MEKKEFLKGWTTEKILGKGTFGTVYEISRVKEDGTVEKSALKVVNIPKNEEELLEYQTMYTDAELPAFFEVQKNAVVKEFETMQMFSNDKHIVSYQEHAVSMKEDGQGWTAVARMELLTPLTTYLKTHALTERDVVNIGIDICCGLETLNAAGVVHRDIKYQNMFIDDDKNFKLGDFGTARSLDHTTMATKKGTIGFMAPEVYNNTPCNQTLDYYSVGMVLYWLLNERRIPFLPLPPAIPTPSQNEMAITRRMSGEQIPEPKFGSDRLKKVIAKAMEFDPAKRYKTATEMKFDLIEVLQKEYLETVVLNQSGVAPVVYPAATATETITETIAEPSIETVTESVFEKTVVPDITETITVFGNTEVKQEEKAETKQEKEIDIEKTVSVFDGENKVVKEEPKPKKKSKLGLLIGLAAVIAAVVLGIVFFGGDKEITSNNLVYWGVDSSNVLRFSTSALTSSETSKASGTFYENEGMNKPRDEWKDVVAVEVKDLVSPVGRFSFENLDKCKTMDIKNLDTSRITNMYMMFYGCKSLKNLDLSTFKIKNVTSMSYMLSNCNFEEINLKGLDLTKVPYLERMFARTTIGRIEIDKKHIPTGKAFDEMAVLSPLNKSFLGLVTKQEGKTGNIYWGVNSMGVLTISSNPLSNAETNKASGFFDEEEGVYYPPKEWLTAKSVEVKDPIHPKYAFSFTDMRDCISFGISNLDTSRITTMDSMFTNCESVSKLELFDFDTRNVTSMHDMFYRCLDAGIIDVRNFDTSNVTNMICMFGDCKKWTPIGDISFVTANVTNMQSMFLSCEQITELDLRSFDTSNVESMLYMFNGCKNLMKLDISSFDTSNVIDMGMMFADDKNLENIKLGSGFKTSKVYNMYAMFFDCNKLKDLNLSGFDTSNVLNMGAMFYNCDALTSLDLRNFNTSSVTSMQSMFYSCDNLEKLWVTSFGTSNVVEMQYMFSECRKLRELDLTSFDTRNVKNMTCMFAYNNALENLLFGSSWNTSSVRDMTSMFFECKSLRAIDLSGFDTSNVESMTAMFFCCENLEQLDVSRFNTSNVTATNSMFSQCRKLEHIDVSHFDTSKVTNMFDMFAYCNKLKEINVSSFNTSKVEDISGMFYQCYELKKIDASNFDTSNVVRMTGTFAYCSNLEEVNVSGWNTSKTEAMTSLFYDCKKLKKADLSSFDMSNVKESGYMFVNTGLSANSTGLRI